MYNNILLRNLVEQSPIGVIITDHKGDYLLMSSNFKQMWKDLDLSSSLPKNAADTKIITMYHLNDEPYKNEEFPVYRVLHHQERIENERMKIKLPSQQWRHAQVSACPIFIEGVLSYVTVICEDITDKIKSQEEACESQIASRFLATMSHEIRTPIHGILGMLDVLCETSLSSEQQKHVSVIQRSTKNLLVILNDILDYSKWKAQKVELNNTIYKVREIFTDVHTLFSSVTVNSEIDLSMTIDESVPEYNYGDSQRLTQCLNNIVSNAVKFVVPDKRNKVDIKVGKIENNISVIISDTGIGMSSTTITKLFEPFMQADSSITRRYGGTGLGLSIAKQIMEQMEGSIHVESKVNVGSTFTVTFPVKHGDGDRHEDKATKRKRIEEGLGEDVVDGTESPSKISRIYKEIYQETSRARILLAEDNPVNKMITTTLLTKRGYRVTAVEDGLEVLRVLDNDPMFDILLLDIQMPMLDGHETCKRLREKKWNNPIIALTASAMESDREKCLSVGMNDYMAKPFELKELIDKLEHWVAIQKSASAPEK